MAEGEKVRVRAAEGRTVALGGPPYRFLAPGEEAEVELTTHIRRRIAKGDLAEVAAPRAERGPRSRG